MSKNQIDPLAIECPTCEAPPGMSCPAFEDGDTNHFTRALAAPLVVEPGSCR